jgi:hypothetical protein
MTGDDPGRPVRSQYTCNRGTIRTNIASFVLTCWSTRPRPQTLAGPSEFCGGKGVRGMLGLKQPHHVAKTGILGAASQDANAVGVRGVSESGRGGVFTGGVAQVRLAPTTAAIHPASGRPGDLFFDKSHGCGRSSTRRCPKTRRWCFPLCVELRGPVGEVRGVLDHVIGSGQYRGCPPDGRRDRGGDCAKGAEEQGPAESAPKWCRVPWKDSPSYRRVSKIGAQAGGWYLRSARPVNNGISRRDPRRSRPWFSPDMVRATTSGRYTLRPHQGGR